MKISQKRTCNGCKAEDLKSCALNYKVENVFMLGRIVGNKPLEPCPKPKTHDEFIHLLTNN